MKYVNLCLLLVLLTGCNAVKKTLDKQTSKADSTITIRETSIAVAKHDSVINKSKVSNWEKITEINFDTTATDKLVIDSVRIGDVYYRTTRPIKTISVKESGIKEAKSNGSYTNLDTAVTTKDNTTSVNKEEVKITKAKESKKVPVALIGAGLVIVLALLAYLIYGKRL